MPKEEKKKSLAEQIGFGKRAQKGGLSQVERENRRERALKDARTKKKKGQKRLFFGS